MCLYRRIDDDFLDPQVFRSDSLLGVAGLMEIYKKGRVALANAPGTGIADDKSIYAYVPKIIEYYMGEKILIPNRADPYLRRARGTFLRACQLKQISRQSGQRIGRLRHARGTARTPDERAEFARRIQQNPRNYIAQPTLGLSRVPVIADGRVVGRHVDLRPYVLYGSDIYVLPGGLTRVALKAGSLVVNSSQGGGSKDTWVLQA